MNIYLLEKTFSGRQLCEGLNLLCAAVLEWLNILIPLLLNSLGSAASTQEESGILA